MTFNKEFLTLNADVVGEFIPNETNAFFIGKLTILIPDYPTFKIDSKDQSIINLDYSWIMDYVDKLTQREKADFFDNNRKETLESFNYKYINDQLSDFLDELFASPSPSDQETLDRVNTAVYELEKTRREYNFGGYKDAVKHILGIEKLPDISEYNGKMTFRLSAAEFGFSADEMQFFKSWADLANKE